MSSPTSLLPLQTWRLLGLGVSATLFALGSTSILFPLARASDLGIEPTTAEGRSITKRAVTLLGARDLAISTALFFSYARGNTMEMGVLIASGSVFYVADVVVAAKGPRGWDGGVWVIAGAAGVAVSIGAGLVLG